MRLSVILLWLAMPAMAVAADPFARLAVSEAGPIVPGQQVHVIVDVFVPDFFTSPPQFPLFSVPNAIVTLPDERAQNLVQTIDGIQYSGIRRTYAVVPETAGNFLLPEFGVELGYSQDGKSVRATVQVPSVGFDVVSHGQEKALPVFAARALTLTQSFDRDPASLKAGDALVRSILITAQDTQAMLIPPVDAGKPDGLAAYEKPIKIEDNVTTSSGSASRRTETIVYTAANEGAFSIPAVSYPWFDIESQSVEIARLPAVAADVAAAVRRGSGIEPQLHQDRTPSTPSRIKQAAVAIAALLLACCLIWLAWRMMPRLGPRISAWRAARQASPRRRLQELRKTVLAGDEMEIYAGLQQWSATLGYRSLADWAADAHSPDLRQQIVALERRLFRQDQVEIDRALLARLLTRRGFAIAARSKSALPDLNPATN